MFNGKINELKEFLLLPLFIAVIRFPPPCGGGGGGKKIGDGCGGGCTVRCPVFGHFSLTSQ